MLADTTVYSAASSHVPSSLTLHPCDLLRLYECREASCKFDAYRASSGMPYHGWVSEQDVSGPGATIERRPVPWP